MDTTSKDPGLASQSRRHVLSGLLSGSSRTQGSSRHLRLEAPIEVEERQRVSIRVGPTVRGEGGRVTPGRADAQLVHGGVRGAVAGVHGADLDWEAECFGLEGAVVGVPGAAAAYVGRELAVEEEGH